MSKNIFKVKLTVEFNHRSVKTFVGYGEEQDAATIDAMRRIMVDSGIEVIKEEFSDLIV